MRKSLAIIASVSLLYSSCSSYTASGAMVGSEFGHVIGSAIGGITGGWRGHEMGSLIGTVGGAVAGAAIGAAVEQSAGKSRPQDDERMQGDDRIEYDETPSVAERRHPHHSVRASDLARKPAVELRHAVIFDTDHNGVLTRGEECTVMFEVMNNTSSAIYDVYPIVEDVTGNRHVKVSPNLRVESIAPHQGIRYTATILADRKLKDGEILIRVGVALGDNLIDSQTQQFTIPTRKRAD